MGDTNLGGTAEREEGRMSRVHSSKGGIGSRRRVGEIERERNERAEAVR